MFDDFLNEDGIGEFARDLFKNKDKLEEITDETLSKLNSVGSAIADVLNISEQDYNRIFKDWENDKLKPEDEDIFIQMVHYANLGDYVQSQDTRKIFNKLNK